MFLGAVPCYELKCGIPLISDVYFLLGAQDMHVVCRIFQKIGSGPQNGAQYGAPYMEEEWEEEDEAIENTPTSGTSTEMAAITDTASAESNVEDEKVFSNINELVQVSSRICYPSVRYYSLLELKTRAQFTCGCICLH